ncbi:MAG: hypothetical protein ACOYT8_04130 [Candidatus Dependentiae bacterium]
MNNKSKLLALFLLFACQTSTMLEATITSVILIPLNNRKRVPNKLTRKWLNWIYAQNRSITSSNEVLSNFNYYHEMVKNHYNYLLHKDKNQNPIKKLKLKKAVASTAINTILWAATILFVHESNKDRYSIVSERYVLSAMITGFLGVLSFMSNYSLVNSYFKHDRMMQHNLNRDQDMLQQFEEYKAAMNN